MAKNVTCRRRGCRVEPFPMREHHGPCPFPAMLTRGTGMPVVDTNVAMQLIRAADAARLLGCDTILVGVQPEIAQTLIGLGADLRGIATRSTLAEGLRAALRKVGFRLVRGDGRGRSMP